MPGILLLWHKPWPTLCKDSEEEGSKGTAFTKQGTFGPRDHFLVVMLVL